MGAAFTSDLATILSDGQMSLANVLRAHFSSNLYPTVSWAFIPTAVEAVECGAAEDFVSLITLPNGRELTVSEILSQLHLWEYVHALSDDVDGEGDEE